jgi:threonine dehydrogenase-like Zn-dependent dehydrogenase
MTTPAATQPTIQAKLHPTETMKAVSWIGTKKVIVADVPRPLITDPNDVIVQVTSASICGSDLHLYHNEIPEMAKGDILGHEFMVFCVC